MVDKLSRPIGYNLAFNADLPVVNGNADEEFGRSGDVGEAAAKDDGEVHGSTFLQDLSEKGQRGSVLLAEMYKKVYDGSLDQSIVKLAALGGTSDMELALQAANVEVIGELGKDLKDLMKSLHSAEQVVRANVAGAPPPASLRELVRRNSDGESDRMASHERAEYWRKAIAMRKKLVTIQLVSNPRCEASWKEALKKTPASNFKGKVNEKHRVFVLSCDLLTQTGKEPWVIMSEPDAKIVEETIKFMKGSKGDADVLMGFDGCQRKMRRVLEDSFGTLPATAEIFLIYKTSWNSWISWGQVGLGSVGSDRRK